MKTKKILVATDFSTTDRKMLKEAVALATRLEVGEVTLFHSYAPLELTDIGFADPIGKEDEILPRVHERLQSWAEEFSTDDVRLVPQTAPGPAVHALIEASGKYDLMIMSSGGQGRRRALGFLLGSTVERVVRGAGCDVWVVRVAAEMPS